MSDLKLCPFCGGENVSSEGRVLSDQGQQFCFDCGASGPHPSYDLATWNTRATPDLTAAAEAMAEALKGLEKAATDTIRFGAQTGPHWTWLTAANLKARAALAKYNAVKEGK